MNNSGKFGWLFTEFDSGEFELIVDVDLVSDAWCFCFIFIKQVMSVQSYSAL